jgi:hypothetical protein
MIFGLSFIIQFILDSRTCNAIELLFFVVENQLAAVDHGALAPLHDILMAGHSKTLVSATACIRNLSIHRLNEVRAQQK